MRFVYIFCRIANDLVSLFSRALNAFLFGGSTAQTLSARAFLEGYRSTFWRRMGKVINWLFFWETNHIERAWENEVDRARYVLDRLEGLK